MQITRIIIWRIMYYMLSITNHHQIKLARGQNLFMIEATSEINTKNHLSWKHL